MRRSLGCAAVVVAVLVLAVAFLSPYRLVLTPAEISPKTPGQPPWKDPRDCAKIQGMLDEARNGKPSAITEPLRDDELAVYRVVLSRRTADSRDIVNLASRTFPLGAYHSEGCECFMAMSIESLSRASRSYRNLVGDVLPGTNIRLVDPKRQLRVVRTNDPGRTIAQGRSVDDAVENAFKTGLLSMSEIAFDKEHQHALVSYAFVCGGLCGSGATLMLEKVDGEWKVSDRDCGGWIS